MVVLTPPLSQHVVGLLQKGSALVRVNRYHEAIDVLERAYDLAPRERDVLRPLALAYMGTGNTHEARRLARRVANLAPHDAAARLVQAESYFMDGRLADALHHARRATRITPSDVEAWLLRAKIHLDLSEYKPAARAYSRVLGEVDSVEAFAGRAQTRVLRGRVDDARHDVIHALAIDPQHPLALQVRQTLRRQGVSETQLLRTPAQLAWDRLEHDYWGARKSRSPQRKARYMGVFNDVFAEQLTHEGAALERLAKYHAYLVMEVGQRLRFCIHHHLRPHPAHERRYGQTNVCYAPEYNVADRILQGGSPVQAYFQLPARRDHSAQALIVFRGTSTTRWQDGIGKEMGVRSGVRADIDPLGVGHDAFYEQRNTVRDWIKFALAYQSGITFVGHSLGGAFADRAYVMAHRMAKRARVALRLVTFNAPALDAVTVQRHPAHPEQVFKFIATGDIVHRGGEVHLDGTVLRYRADKFALRQLMANHKKADLSDGVITRKHAMMGSVLGTDIGVKVEAGHGRSVGRIWEGMRRAFGLFLEHHAR